MIWILLKVKSNDGLEFKNTDFVYGLEDEFYSYAK